MVWRIFSSSRQKQELERLYSKAQEYASIGNVEMTNLTWLQILQLGNGIDISSYVMKRHESLANAHKNAAIRKADRAFESCMELSGEGRQLRVARAGVSDTLWVGDDGHLYSARYSPHGTVLVKGTKVVDDNAPPGYRSPLDYTARLYEDPLAYWEFFDTGTLTQKKRSAEKPQKEVRTKNSQTGLFRLAYDVARIGYDKVVLDLVEDQLGYARGHIDRSSLSEILIERYKADLDRVALHHLSVDWDVAVYTAGNSSEPKLGYLILPHKYTIPVGAETQYGDESLVHMGKVIHVEETHRGKKYAYRSAPGIVQKIVIQSQSQPPQHAS